MKQAIRITPLDTFNLALLGLLLMLLYAPFSDTPDNTPITQLGAEAIHEIQIFKEQQLQLALLRDKDGWLMTHPEIARAHNDRIARLLGLLQAPSRWQNAQIKQHAFGVDKPSLRVQFDTHSIVFGRASTPPGQRYITHAGQAHLIDEDWYRLLSLPARFYLQP